MMTRPTSPLWISVGLLICAIGVVGTNALLLSPLVQPVGTELGVDVTHVMRAASAYGLGVALAALVLAPLGDRMGAGRLLRLSLAVLAVGFVLSAAAPNLWALIAAQALCGVAGGASLPSIYTLAAVIAPKGREARVVGAVLTGWTLSLVLGVSVAAWAADLLGWRAVYWSLATVTALLWLGCASLVRLTGPSGTTSSPLTALRVPGMGRGLFATVGLMLSFYVTYSFTGAHVTIDLELSTAQAGFVPLVYGLGFGLAVMFDPLLDRIGMARATPPAFVGLALVYVGMAIFGESYPLLLTVMLFWGILQHLALNLLVARLTALDQSQRGAIMGVYSTATYLSVFAAPFIGGWLFAAIGFIGCVLLSALLAFAEAVESRSLRHAKAPLSAGDGDELPASL